MSQRPVQDFSIFDFDDYKAFIKARVAADPRNWGAWRRLAIAADCQPTYLSQAMRGKAHLLPDHLHGIALHWNLSEREEEFFLLLLELARAAKPGLKDFVIRKIEKLRSEENDLKNRLKQPSLESSGKEGFYYSSWHWSAIHVIVSIPEYRTSSAIAQRLQLPKVFVEQCLEKMKELGFVRKEGALWKLGTADLHISKNSPMVFTHHNNWRNRAVLDSSMLKPESVHFTGVYSISKTDYKKLRRKVIELIEASRKIVTPSKEEELVCFLCDFFQP